MMFYYITHLDNLNSILANGILSRDRIMKEDVQYTQIADICIVGKRMIKQTLMGKVYGTM
jgi:hypothetical protein